MMNRGLAGKFKKKHGGTYLDSQCASIQLCIKAGKYISLSSDILILLLVQLYVQ